MADILDSIELTRRQRQLRQVDLATALGVTQGHYSKVVSGLAPLSGKLEARMKEWLGADPVTAAAPDRARRMKALSSSIHAQCAELLQLASQPA